MREPKGIIHAHLFDILRYTAKLAAVVAFAAIMLLCTSFPAAARAEQITQTVSLANARKNQSGPGYFWDNINDTLTLNGLNIDTGDDYGLKLPDNATVVLVGNNRITASKVALLTTGTTIFKGSGTLTLTAGETGIVLADPTNLGKVSFLSGSYKINATGDGIYSDKVRLYIAGGDFEINCGGYAIRSLQAEINDASVTANGAVYSSEPMVINNAALELTAASGDALQTDKELRISNVKMTAGADAGSASEVTDGVYTGGAYVKTEPTFVRVSYSTLFGGEVPAWVDYVVFAAAATGLAAVIAVPLIMHRRRYHKRLENLKKTG
jgi:hypothetical protein